MTAPALPPAIVAALDAYARAESWHGYAEDSGSTQEAEESRVQRDAARAALETAIAAELAKLQTGLAIAESFVRTSTAEIAAAYDAGRDAATLEPSEVEALHAARTLLKEIEWSGNAWGECCPACRRYADGHAPGCRLAALLQGGTPT